MDGKSNVGEAGPSSPRPNQRSFLDDLAVTFSSPMAWLLVLALIVTWSGVAIVLFDLLDYKTLAEYTSYCDDPMCLWPGLDAPSPAVRKAFKSRGGFRPIKSSPAGAAGDVTSWEGTDWLELLWKFAASLVAPDEEEEGIQQLTESITSFHSEEF